MNNYSDKHLNIFQAFTQAGSLPIENNISRGLAIVFQEEPAFLMHFINYLRCRMKADSNSLDNIAGEYNVFFQMHTKCEEFKFASKVLGVTLTAEDIFIGNDETFAKNKEYITDISIQYEDTLIIIEVKRTSENCEKQLKEQIDSLNKEDAELTRLGIVSIKWSDIVRLLKQYIKMTNDYADRITQDYYDFLLGNYPQWNIVDKLSKLEKENKEGVRQRLDQIKTEYVKKCSLPTIEMNNRGNVTINNCNYVKEFALFQEDKGDISFSVWLGDSGQQSKELYKSGKFTDESFSQIKKKAIENGFSVSFEPYVKFSHIMGRGIGWIYQKSECFNATEWQKFTVGHVKKMKTDNEEWDAFLECIKQKNDWWDGPDNLENIKGRFAGKTFSFISFGIALHICIPFEKAQEYDEKGTTTDFLKEMVEMVTVF